MRRSALSSLLIVLLLGTYSSTHATEVRVSNFLLYGEGVEKIAHNFTEMKEKIENLTGLRSNREVIYYFFDTTKAFVRATGLRWWIAAIYTDSKVYLQPVRVLSSRRILKQVIAHEYIHFLIDKSGYHVPFWVNEAVSIYFTERFTDRKVKEFDVCNINRLKEVLQEKSSRTKLRSVYQILRGYASMLLQRHTLSEILEKPETWFNQKFKLFMDRYPLTSWH